MWMAARGIVAGTMTIGDVVLVNTYLLQLYQPLGVFGWVYREIKQALVDMEKMFDLLLADTLNGAPLSPEHGLPLRPGVPGFYGTNSVKRSEERRVGQEWVSTRRSRGWPYQ